MINLLEYEYQEIIYTPNNWFQVSHVCIHEWPGRFPYLNPIENLWDELASRVGARTTQNEDVLFDDLLNE